MNRTALAASLSLITALAAGCQLPIDQWDRQGMSELRITAMVAGTPINALVVTVTAADITTPLVFNLATQNGVAQGTIRIPPGLQRNIDVQAFDSDGNVVAEGSKTIDVKPGQNPPVSIPMVSKAGQVTITVTLGPVSVVVQPAAATVPVASTLQLAVTITAANGDVLAVPADYWATANPAIATVDQNGVVTALLPGMADIIATFAGVAGVSHVTVATPPPPPPAPVPQIAFVSNGEGRDEIYVINADGTNQTRLTDLTTVNDGPAWSPDGAKLAFTSTRDGNLEIYVMNADGTGVVRLTNNAADDLQPAWSPDGSRIAFVSSRDGRYHIYLMNADGSGVAALDNFGDKEFQPAWSPDGTRIAYVVRQETGDNIVVVNQDGTGGRQLTDADDDDPSWSPDGTRIVFTSRQRFTSDIYLMNADGSGVVRLTNNGADNQEPAWSPDGSEIAFASDQSGSFEIYVMSGDGTGVLALTNNPGAHFQPRWRPR
jgi:Tol biopolymer transport system component